MGSGEGSNNNSDIVIFQWERARNGDPRTMVPLQDGSKTPFDRGSMNPVGAENQMRAYNFVTCNFVI